LRGGRVDGLLLAVLGVRTTDDCGPITWVGRVPVYFTAVLTAIYALGMIGTTVAAALRYDISALLFVPDAFLEGNLWQPFTCTLIQPTSFFSLFALLFLYTAGCEVEKYLGRRRFLVLFSALILLPAIWLPVWNLFGQSVVYFGPHLVTAALFIAFATLYPSVEWFGMFQLKWVAVAAMALGTLMYLPGHRWGELGLFWGMCAMAFAFVRALQRGAEGMLGDRIIEVFRRRRPVPSRAVRRNAVARRSADAPPPKPADCMEEIDPLLDKIARHGIESLTADERSRLERARLALLEKSGR
jgi:hypothetical protein